MSFSFKSLKKVILVGSASLILASCATNIKQITENPDQFNKQQVTVKGKVVEPANLGIVKFYKLVDDTGSIYIITDKVPAEGSELTVNGEVVKAFEIMGKSWTVINTKNSK